MTSTARMNRYGNVGSGSNLPNAEPSRSLHGSSFASGFGNGSSGWIWGGTAAVGSGTRKNGSVESGRNQDEISGPPGNVEAITGSSSFLHSDGWSGHHATQWKTVDKTSPTLPSSSMRRQSTQLLPHVESGPGNSSYFPNNQGASINQEMAIKQSRKPFPDPTTSSFVSSNFFNKAQTSRSRHNSDEENPYPLAYHSDMTTRMQSERQPLHNFSGYNSSAASRSGSVDPPRYEDPFNNQYSQLGPTTSNASHRQSKLSTHPPSHTPRTGSYAPKTGSQPSPTQVSALSGDFTKMNIGGRENQNPYFSQQKKPTNSGNNAFLPDFSHQIASNDTSESWEDSVYPADPNGFTQDSMIQGGLVPHQSLYQGTPFTTTYTHSPSNSDARRGQQSPFYSSTGTPTSGMQHRVPKVGLHVNGSTGQAALLDRKLQGLQQEQQEYPSQSNQIQFRPPFAQSYDFHPQNQIRMNPLAPFYMATVPALVSTQAIPRGPAREHDVGQPVRSALLEEFRTNGKTNKRYELKDIYNHVVEFSGDQHGSRFIQQKLETANSDEKEQVFREIHPNSLQLMTDVFGNYVIQKFFEHGNQGQKKILASQMKNHILTLSMQMYGCRVVQKALEHILTDQQALLIKELENHVLKCVRDQNGNHVIQKAIERVPAEHIQFIINAFTGQVHHLAIHPYGCRVIQRMLEHCEEPTRSALLKELHICASFLIIDQYGNYVTQHVIEHGREEDRAKVISLITGNLVTFSKHKFASNVVEKSIQFGTADQRGKIISTLTVLNEKGESPLQSLIRDQYGNYVIQKLLTQLKDAESEQFVELIKPQLALLKRFSYGKQIAAIEKMVYNNPPSLLQVQNNHALPPPIDTSAANTPALFAGDAQSPHSNSVPSTDVSSIDGLAGSRTSSTSNTLELMTPTST